MSEQGKCLFYSRISIDNVEVIMDLENHQWM